MSWLIRLALSSIGAKVVMALTGVVLVGFLVGHMVGNLQVFGGPDPLNAYAEFLHSKPALVWTVRSIVIASALLHILSSLRLTWLNNAARPVAYRLKRPVISTLSSRNMFVSGLVIFAFVVYHLLQLTWRVTNPDFAAMVETVGTKQRPDVYSMVVASFRDPTIAGAYIVALVLLGLHLWHAIASMFQSLGLTAPRYESLIHGVSLTVATIIVVGNITMPVAILLGWIAPVAKAVIP
jgi:succinate dehydrogenase / fumarate reductase, cytochrome b subunit